MTLTLRAGSRTFGRSCNGSALETNHLIQTNQLLDTTKKNELLQLVSMTMS